VPTGGILSVVNRSIQILIDQNVDYATDWCKDYLTIYPEIEDVGLLEFDRAQECYERGYEYGKTLVPQVKAFIEGTH
jgi:predicted acylesterase/phospholipase RssA